MKKALVVFAVLMMMALVFTGCDKAGDEKPSGNITFKTADGYTLTCKTDGTWICHLKDTKDGVELDFDVAKGTYTGTPAEDGECTVYTTHEIDGLTMLFVIGGYVDSGKTKITSNDIPLKQFKLDTTKTETITIKDGKFTLDGTDYTRK